MLTRRGFAGFASCAICAVTGFVASDASAAEGAPPPVTPGLTRKMLSQMDGPMPGYVTLNMEVEIEAGAVVPRHTHPGIESSYVLEGGFRTPRTRSADPHVESGRWFPNSARNAPCRRQARRQKDQDRDHLRRGEGQTARVSSLKHASPKGSRRRLWLPGNRADGYRPAIGGTIEGGI